MSQQMRRRHFLQLAWATLATTGLSQVELSRQAHNYNRALAQPTRRKLALLVGINAYPDSIQSLRGCLTDVELQYELLVYRYGFNPRDILVVSDRTLTLPGQVIAPPTRQNILEAFETHLIDQAEAGDVVVFHYSGHGSYVQEDDGIPKFGGVNGTIVPYDARAEAGNAVDDIMGKTLFLLSLALPTEHLAMVLDSCYSGGGIRGNVVVRALTSRHTRPSQRELAYQDQWMARLNLEPADLLQRRRRGIAKGMALGSARVSQLAADIPFDGFHAGAFTYLLTRYLWQLPIQQSLTDAFVNLARSTRDLANTTGIIQDPVYATDPDRSWKSAPIYFLTPERPAAEAVMQSIDGNQVRFWLGGMAVDNLSAQPAVFSVVDDRGNLVGEVLQTERQGLRGLGTLQARAALSAQPGQLMREQLRGIPLNLTLRIGLAGSLAEEESEGLARLNAISRIEGVPVTQETSIDYLLGRLTATAQAGARERQGAIATSTNSIGILTPDLTPVEQTFGPARETLPQAIQRLRPRLKMLLAGKMLGTLTNSNASRVNVDVTILRPDTELSLLSVGSRSAQEAGQARQSVTHSAQIPAGSELQVQVRNHESRHLFVSILTIASTGEMAILHPVVWDAPEAAARITPGQTLLVPDLTDGRDRFRFVAQGPAGFFELMVLVSAEPLRDALRSLQTIAHRRGTRSGNPLAFADGIQRSDESEDTPVNVVDALLGDLDRGASRGIGVVGNSQRVDARQLAAFSLVIEVVDSRA